MRFSEISCRAVRLPFRFSFGHSLASRSFSDNVIVQVRLTTGDGIVCGLGESVPRDYVTGETAQGAIEAIEKKYAPLLLDREFADVADFLSYLSSLFFQFQLDKIPAGASFAALEIACLDACAKLLKKPLFALPQFISKISDPRLKDLATTSSADIWSQLDEDRVFRYGGVVPFGKRRVLAALLRFYKFYGFTTVKLKVGADGEEDLKRVQMARQIMGESACVRIDANCAYDLDSGRRMLERFRPFRPASIEQPFRPQRGNLEDFTRLQSEIPETVIVDESLTTSQDAEALINEGACRGFNIRISKVGGIMASMRLVQLARNASLECHLGAQVGESGILASAQRHFALAYPQFTNVEGAMNLFLLKRDLTNESQTVPFGALTGVRRGDSGGLGVTIKDQNLEQLSIV